MRSFLRLISDFGFIPASRATNCLLIPTTIALRPGRPTVTVPCQDLSGPVTSSIINSPPSHYQISNIPSRYCHNDLLAEALRTEARSMDEYSSSEGLGVIEDNEHDAVELEA